MTGRLIAFRPPRIALSFVLIAIAAHWLLPLQLHDSRPAAAAAAGLAGFALMIRAWWLFRLADTAICPTAASTTLITRDVFLLSRNPMYLGIALMLTGLALSVGSLPFYVAAVAFFAAMDLVFCPYEEQKAHREFGAEYRAYMHEVRRWL